MTKRDFEAIAAAIRAARNECAAPHYTTPDHGAGFDDGASAAACAVAGAVADYCATVNPRFDRARFMAACG